MVLVSKADAVNKKGGLKKGCRTVTAKNGRIMYFNDKKPCKKYKDPSPIVSDEEEKKKNMKTIQPEETETEEPASGSLESVSSVTDSKE